jgi:RNA polymerase sigma factor (sigma-70 family)
MKVSMAMSGGEPIPILSSAGHAVDDVVGRVIDESAMSVDDVVERYWLSMFKLAMLLVAHQQTAEEITQEAFTRWYVHRTTVKHPPAYLRSTVVNLAHGHHRKLRVVRRRAHLFTTQPDSAQGPPSEMLLDMVNALPVRQRAVVVLRFYEGCTEAEIAEIVGCRPGTVKSLLSRALVTLRRGIEI